MIHMANDIDWTEGVKHPRVRFSARVRGARCEIYVTDNGPGIHPSLAERVFEPFFSRKEGGRGMGLTIAKNILESHRGTMRALVDGRRRGAAVLLSLPRKRARATLHRT